jgi:hypothetical protein
LAAGHLLRRCHGQSGQQRDGTHQKLSPHLLPLRLFPMPFTRLTGKQASGPTVPVKDERPHSFPLRRRVSCRRNCSCDSAMSEYQFCLISF